MLSSLGAAAAASHGLRALSGLGHAIRSGLPSLLVIGTAAGFMTLLPHPAASVRVPHADGMQISALRTWGAQAGVPIVLDASRPSRVAAGTVLDQFPAAGLVLDRGDALHVTISADHAWQAVPALTGVSVQKAVAILHVQGLKANTRLVSSPNEPTGRVISQTPGSDLSVARGTTIDLAVSSGPARQLAPNLVGVSQADAARMLSSQNLGMVVRGEVYSPAPAGTIVDEKPAAGSLLPYEGQVSVTLSAGGAPQQTVPQVVGMTVQQAQALAAASGFQLTTPNSSVPGPYFIVTSQAVPAGQSIAPQAKLDAQGQMQVNRAVLQVSVTAPQSQPQAVIDQGTSLEAHSAPLMESADHTYTNVNQ